MSSSSSPPPTNQSADHRQSARTSSHSKTPLPRYTSIDLENDLPEIYSTSLNPNIHDPDMTMFFNRNAPPFHTNYAKRHSPPPSYSSRPKSGSSSSINSQSTLYLKKNRKRNLLIGSFLCIFLVSPLLLLFIFYLIPRVVLADREII